MKERDTITFTVRAKPELIQSATQLALQRGIRRNRLFVKLLERELAAAADGDQPTEQPAKEEVNALAS